MKPARIHLKRTKGYNMQTVSLALNGLPAVKVARPGIYGNPFKSPIPERAVSLFRVWIAGQIIGHSKWRGRMKALRGKNLACFCPLDRPCHSDVLLEMANPETAT